MCGICGKLLYDSEVSYETIERMCKVLYHRGPDDYGTYVDKNIALGHRRLSIIDLSQNGHQPMLSQDGQVCIVFNGEIYNFLTIRQKLEKKGYKFRSNSDTEVILNLYIDSGDRKSVV